MTPGAASKQITALESRLQARLLERTTRSVRLTDAGEALLDRVKPWLDEYDALENGLTQDTASPAGLLRVSAPVDFGARRLIRPVADFMAQWPDVDVRLSLADRMIDLVDEGFDVAVRIGHLSDSTLIAKKLARACLVTIAAPDYLESAPPLPRPADLANHACIIDRNKPTPHLWKFMRDDEIVEVKVGGQLTLNGATAAVEAAAAGAGIACPPLWAAKEALDEGRVVKVLPFWEPDHRDLWAVYPSNRYLAQRVRLFVDHLAASFEGRV